LPPQNTSGIIVNLSTNINVLNWIKKEKEVG
jgi:hypothetical protein